MIQELRKQVQRRLLPWFKRNGRDLPWRRERTPYRVWVAEIMLQQTRVEQARPYYERFMQALPSLAALAQAPLQRVLKLWEGLGYYARARHLHRAAQVIMQHHGGRLPATLAGLSALPGFGPYTTAAVGSLAFNLDAAVLDGNVIRVLSRLLLFEAPVNTPAARRQLQQWADILLVKGQAGLCNEAFMELGALCCLPDHPACATCPLRRACRAFKAGQPAAYPQKIPRMKNPHKIVGAGVIINRRGQILIAQRKESSMLGGLWEFPGGTVEPGETLPVCIVRELQEEMGLHTQAGEYLVTVHHAYTHFTIDLHAYWVRIRSGRPRAIHCAAWAWIKPDEFEKYPFSKADLEIIKAVRAHGKIQFRKLFPAAGRVKPRD